MARTWNCGVIEERLIKEINENIGGKAKSVSKAEIPDVQGEQLSLFGDEKGIEKDKIAKSEQQQTVYSVEKSRFYEKSINETFNIKAIYPDDSEDILYCGSEEMCSGFLSNLEKGKVTEQQVKEHGNKALKSALEDLGEIDKIYIDREKDEIKILYFNPDSAEGGQLITNEVAFDTVFESAKYDDPFSHMEKVGKQTAVDVTHDDFMYYAEEFLCSNEDFRRDWKNKSHDVLDKLLQEINPDFSKEKSENNLPFNVGDKVPYRAGMFAENTDTSVWTVESIEEESNHITLTRETGNIIVPVESEVTFLDDYIEYFKAHSTEVGKDEKTAVEFEITKDMYDTENPYVLVIKGKDKIADIDISVSEELWERLENSGLKRQENSVDRVIFNTDGESWNRFVIPDKWGNKTNNIEISKVLTEKEIKTASEIADKVVFGEKETAKEQPSEVGVSSDMLFSDPNVIEEIQNREKAEDNKFRGNDAVQGEQLSLFGDPEPLTASKPATEKPKSEFAEGPVVDGVQVYEALAAEIDRGTGFVHGKLRVQDFYEEQHPTVQQLADFLKKEYGTGGHSGEGNISLVDYDSKGMTFSFENGEKFRHSWYNVATMTEARLKDDTYLSDEQKAERAVLKAEQAEKLPTPAPTSDKGENFTITDDAIGEGGAKTKFRANANAIRTLKTLEAEKRPATAEEKETLSKYVGWGALSQAFDSSNGKWATEYAELKNLLTPQEYAQARSTVNDAFYTGPAVIDGIYEALGNFGFTGGNVLEPAMGIGNFFGRMPENMQNNSQLYGVEIDSLSGRIAQALYPNADIAIQGFEKNSFQNGCFDVAVGNVPFGELGFRDAVHDTTKLHDYFFMEAMDKLKNGGVMAFVTSAGTLDKRDESTRQMLADKADFIGAIRLPGGKNGAFKDNAGTEVTTDIIFLQKHEGKTLSEMSDIPDWVHIGKTADGLPINKYFANNPDMVLGKVVEGNKLYGSGTMVVAEDGFDLKSALHEAVGKLSAEISHDKARDVYAKTEQGLAVKIPSDLRDFSFLMQDDAIYFKKNAVSFEQRFDKKNAQFGRYKAFIELRDITRELIQAQELDKPDSVIKDLQSKLNAAYDDFYAKYGLIHGQTNKRYFREDISYNLVAALEKSYDKTKLVEKSDIFTKRTIRAARPITHADNALEALNLSVAEKAKVDFEYMQQLTDLPKERLISELQGEIYHVPFTNEYQTASEYLSGDIRQKLKAAQAAAAEFGEFAVNVNALEQVMPEPLKAGDIDIKIGAAWIDPKLYEQFMYETFSTPYEKRSGFSQSWLKKAEKIEVQYSSVANAFVITNKRADHSVNVTNKFGTKKINAYGIMESLLNLKDPKVTKVIFDPVTGKEKRIVDIEATKIAQRKAEMIRKEFSGWIFKDPERREKLVREYNDKFNCIRPREYDGSNLRFPQMNPDIRMQEHQKNAVAHALFGGNTLFAHSVGAGKTFEMIAAAMESKRLGLCTKTLFAVPNHLTEQVGDDFMKLYPSANILVASKSDFTKTNRQQLFSKIAAGNYDAVIIGHSQLKMIPMDKQRQEDILQNQIDDITVGIAAYKKNNENKSFSVKSMERTRKSLVKKLEDLKAKKQDDVITFEQMGIDKLIVDEAHEFKNLFTPTKLTNVAGVSNSASQKALDLFLKCRYLDEKTGGKGVVFATGTPLSNSVTELHTMMRYLEYDFLKDHGLDSFDNWVTVFGEQKTDWELAPAGNKFRQKTRIARYTGLPELMSMFKQVADVRTSDTLNLKVPECEAHVINVEATDFQKQLVQELADRADEINDRNVDPSADNMLKITSDGRKLGLDPRLIDPSFEDDPNTKLNQCVDNVARIHSETAEEKLTQIIFCDLGVPHKNSSKSEMSEENSDDADKKSIAELESLEEECDFCVYDDIRSKLIAKGIPAEEIAYIHDAKTEQQKSELFDKVRSGKVRVLLGSTAKMGTGTNVQDKLIAVHDLDIPWRPADVDPTQRNAPLSRLRLS